MNEYVILIILGVFIVIIIEWAIGVAIGKSLSKDVGVVFGVILILLGVTIFIAIPIIVYSRKNTKEQNININLNTNNQDNVPYRNITPQRTFYPSTIRRVDRTKSEKRIDSKSENNLIKFIGKNWKDILIENNLSEYIDIFEKNKLTDLTIISKLTDEELEKIGITAMGDRKKYLNIFSNNDRVISSEDEYVHNYIKEEIDIVNNDPKQLIRCNNCKNLVNVINGRCSNCGESFY